MEIINMPTKVSDIDFENAIQLYLTGESAEKAAAFFHTSGERLAHELKRRGLLRARAVRYQIVGEKNRATQRAKAGLPDDEIVRLYIEGHSANSLAKQFDVSRTAIRNRIDAAEVPMRGSTDANRLLAEQTPIDEHRRRIKFAQDAIRGKPMPLAQQIKAARTRQEREISVSPTEALLKNWLTMRGVECIAQQAIGPYNVDIGAAPVAVEIFGGGWHASKPKHARRARYIFDQGWHLLFVWVNATRSPLVESVADYIISRLQDTRSQPAATRQYWVIRGDGQELSTGSANDDEITLIIPGYQAHSRRA
jgi:very-short-patch-repair endonuclease